MALYKKLNADKMLVDDKKARKIAEFNNINIIGSLGVLILAKKNGFINEVKSSIELILKSDIFIAEGVVNIALELAGEK